MTHVDLFTGMGGFALAAKWAGFETIVMCEINDKLRGFLEAEWRVPVHDDIKTFNGRRWTGATLLTAGVPCQPASLAGKRLGEKDDRWLWPEALRVTAEARPDWAIFENPAGILSMGIDGILAQLAGIGYETGIVDIPACAVDSPQIRHRIWIVAHAKSDNNHRVATAICSQNEQTQTRRQKERVPEYRGNVGDGKLAHRSKPGPQGSESKGQSQPDRCAAEYAQCSDVGNGSSERSAGVSLPILEGRPREANADADGAGAGELADGNGSYCSQQPENEVRTGRYAIDCRSHWSDYEWIAGGDGKVRRTKPGLGGLVTGLPARVRRPALEALGNAIVPQVAYEIMKAIVAVKGA